MLEREPLIWLCGVGASICSDLFVVKMHSLYKGIGFVMCDDISVQEHYVLEDIHPHCSLPAPSAFHCFPSSFHIAPNFFYVTHTHICIIYCIAYNVCSSYKKKHVILVPVWLISLNTLVFNSIYFLTGEMISLFFIVE